MRAWYGEYELPGVHSEAFPEEDEQSEGGQTRENGPEETAVPESPRGAKPASVGC
jgi:hypothetical protein